MSLGRIKVCLLLGRSNPARATFLRLSAPATFEGQRNLSTDPTIYETVRAPFPYEKKRFGMLESIYDYTTSRLNENSRIVVVDGPPYVGKTEFAQNIAKEFHLKYFPDVTDDDLYVHNGFDLRDLNEFLSNPKMKTYDLSMLYNEPDPKKMYGFGATQVNYMVNRVVKYALALRHVLHTGQGCVLENSVWADGVYGEQLFKYGYFTRAGYKYYKEFRKNAICQLFKPNLVIHLDAPTPYLVKKLKEKNPEFANSPVYNEKYLAQLRQLYTEKYLPYMSKYSEILTYDITDMPDFDLVALDMEKMDLISADQDNPTKFDDWRKSKEEEWSSYRLFLSRDQHIEKMLKFPVPWDATELILDGGEAEEYQAITKTIPQLSYSSTVFKNPDGTLKNTPEVKELLKNHPLEVVG